MARVEIELGTLTNSCFVIMPFSRSYQSQYDRVIRPAVEQEGLGCVRADEIYSKPQITADIWKSLRSARVVIAELTGRSTNVFYEVGLAHALGKPVIIITRSEDDVPFDLKALRYLYYDTDDPFWGDNLRKALASMIQKLLREKEYGTVFSDIACIGKAEYEPYETVSADEEEIHKAFYDLTGVWRGAFELALEEGLERYSCNLHVIQKGDILSGTMMVSFGRNGELTVVQQLITGELVGDNATLHGVSYSFLKQGACEAYSLDTFSGKITPDGNEISGGMQDHAECVGSFSFTRQRLESDTPPEGGQEGEQ
jgi:hypothetical protein